MVLPIKPLQNTGFDHKTTAVRILTSMHFKGFCILIQAHVNPLGPERDSGFNISSPPSLPGNCWVPILLATADKTHVKCNEATFVGNWC